MTIGEGIRAFKAYDERRKDDAYFSYSNAYAIGLFIASIFSTKSPPTIHDIYPEYFPKDEEVEEKVQDIKSEVNFLNFANAFNRKFDNGSDRKPESENNG